MVRNLLAAAVVVVLGGAVVGADLKSGPQTGEKVPGPFHPYNVTGEDAGKVACLYCKGGDDPVVAVFARSSDDAMAPGSVRSRDDARVPTSWAHETASGKGG